MPAIIGPVQIINVAEGLSNLVMPPGFLQKVQNICWFRGI